MKSESLLQNQEVSLSAPDEREPILNALVFFRSVIMSGEQWSEECEAAYKKAMEARDKALNSS